MKIAFLFLTRGDIYQEKVWVDFFEAAVSGYSIYIHPNQDVVLKSAYFSKYEIKDKQSKVGDRVLYAQRALLRAALLDLENQKFVLLTDDCVPLHPFGVFRELLGHDKSLMRYGDTWLFSGHARFIKEIPVGQQANAHWWVLNRRHAELMAQDDHWISICSNYDVSPEHYPSNFLKAQGELENVLCRDILYESYIHPCGVEELSSLDEKSLGIISIARAGGYLAVRKFRGQVLKCGL